MCHDTTFMASKCDKNCTNPERNPKKSGKIATQVQKSQWSYGYSKLCVLNYPSAVDP